METRWRAGRLAGVVSSVLVAMLAVAGCQGQRAEAPATRALVVCPQSLPERQGASPDRVAGFQPAVRGRDALDTTPHGVTTNETAPEIKKVPAEAGKPEPSGPAVELALKFVPGQATTYKITTESRRAWNGRARRRPSLPQFTDGRTGNHVELTFEQRVQQVQDDGSAVLEITIKGLKYVGEVVNKVVLDFDSARPEDSDNPSGGAGRQELSGEDVAQGAGPGDLQRRAGAAGSARRLAGPSRRAAASLG